jgi:hypothetical protein
MTPQVLNFHLPKVFKFRLPLTPFRVEIPQERLDDLAERLERTRWPSPLPGAPWER